jgi:hypothetical protein
MDKTLAELQAQVQQYSRDYLYQKRYGIWWMLLGGLLLFALIGASLLKANIVVEIMLCILDFVYLGATLHWLKAWQVRRQSILQLLRAEPSGSTVTDLLSCYSSCLQRPLPPDIANALVRRFESILEKVEAGKITATATQQFILTTARQLVQPSLSNQSIPNWLLVCNQDIWIDALKKLDTPEARSLCQEIAKR